ncbi:CPXCG motif-containing cysteine-rich protein [Aureibaculum sp. 2210JD6-5]|uniref:CPXCG motif-containing cysteine-rich protein n=1 Tax=Aureibaculum sp. 2210JD6-5 TaxID=3103957 RepID=UPI002AACBE54|nr:CPXCG motif-containing cysteine-rich protein [Aureibaculum sp. 2210JD6-5]MDY7394042.1 CPXCG motif-containing cysteine-rich protein [Aureibaculum sp. 2210JD6-5]
MQEHKFYCPYCSVESSTWIETDKAKQQFIEDCIECNNPLEMIIDCTYNKIVEVMINPIAQ